MQVPAAVDAALMRGPPGASYSMGAHPQPPPPSHPAATPAAAQQAQLATLVRIISQLKRYEYAQYFLEPVPREVRPCWVEEPLSVFCCLVDLRALGAVAVRERGLNGWGAVQVEGYYETIQRPMDLGTILSNAHRGAYPSAGHCHTDVMQVWQNCYRFNVEGSEIFRAAQHCEALYRRMCAEAGLR